MIRMFLYAQIYWLAEFGNVSYLLSESGDSHSDLGGFGRTFVGQFGRTFVGVKSDKTLCPT